MNSFKFFKKKRSFCVYRACLAAVNVALDSQFVRGIHFWLSFITFIIIIIIVIIIIIFILT